MSVSVIVPNYNHGKWLAQSLRAIATQTEPPTEIIVVDDASTDDSIDVITRLKAEYPLIQIVRHDRNRGVVAAFATGVGRSSGDFIAFPAADDHVLPDLFRHAVSALTAHPKAAFFCSEVALIDQDNNIVGFRPPVIPRWSAGYMSPDMVRRRIRQSDNWFVGPSVIYRRSLLESIGYYDEALGSLTDGMTNRLLAFRYGCYFEPRVLATWRVYPQSYSARSVLSPTEGQRLLSLAREWGGHHFPEDVRDEYISLLDRRLRFNMGRLHLVWGRGKADWQSISDIAGWNGFDRAVLRVLCAMPLLSSWLALAWMTIRLRPSGLVVTAMSFARAMVLSPVRRRALARTIENSGS